MSDQLITVLNSNESKHEAATEEDNTLALLLELSCEGWKLREIESWRIVIRFRIEVIRVLSGQHEFKL